MEGSQIRRYEAKYTITEDTARAIREWIRPVFSPDAHADPATGAYTVNNLYLDTPDRRFYLDTKLRKRRRFKLRVRYYGPEPDDFLVLEVKSRDDRIVWKRRDAVDAARWPDVLGEVPAGGGRPDSFLDLATLCGATPVLHVRYTREPWVSDVDDYGRVTFDRELRYRLCYGAWEMATDEGDLVLYDDPVTARSGGSPIVLEVKTETWVPPWAQALVQRFDLVQSGFSKYCFPLDRCAAAWAEPRVSAW